MSSQAQLAAVARANPDNPAVFDPLRHAVVESQLATKRRMIGPMLEFESLSIGHKEGRRLMEAVACGGALWWRHASPKRCFQ